MQDYLYKFDYVDPELARLNQLSGHEEYSSGYFKIRAKSEADALAWGGVLADWLVMHLFEDPSPGRWSRTIGFGTTWDGLPRHRVPLMERTWNSPAIIAGEYPDVESALRLLKW